jgi:hypothetical protein
MPDTHTLTVREIPWTPASPARPLPLGRHVRHDSRSLAYPYRRTGQPLMTVLHKRNVPIFDQLQTGSCTGQAETGALGTDPLYATLPAGHVALNEAEALRLYSAAEVIDGDGPFPPQDNGSSGLSVCKAAKNAGLISGFTHCLSLADVLDALQSGPVILGTQWYDSMDSPDSSGLVTISPGAQVRGGHEYVARGIDVARQLVLPDNSWGLSWGLNGSFSMGWGTLERLLSEQGDGTVSIPLTSPPPQPVPVPVPVPVPPPGPVPVPAADPDLAYGTDPELIAWAGRPHGMAGNRYAAEQYAAWRTAKGFE